MVQVSSPADPMAAMLPPELAYFLPRLGRISSSQRPQPLFSLSSVNSSTLSSAAHMKTLFLLSFASTP
jgi:hypothetical protein